jgi:tetratricopeptide (TPR) repeat protein
MALEDILKKAEGFIKAPDTTSDDINLLALQTAEKAGQDWIGRILEIAVQNGKTSGLIYYNLGTYYESQGKKGHMIELWQRAILENKTISRIFNQLGVIYYELGLKDVAKSIWETAIERDQTDADIWQNLGTYYIEKGDEENAVKIWETAVEKEQTSPIIFWNLGINYGKQEEITKAALLWEKAAQAEQTTPQILEGLALCYFKLENFERMVQVSEYSIKTGQTTADILDNLAFHYNKIGDKKKSIEILELAVKSGLTDDSIFFFLSNLYREMGELEKERETLERAVELGQTNSHIFYNLAACYSQSEEKEKATAILEKAVELGKAEAGIFYHLGLHYINSGDYKKGDQCFEKIREIAEREDNKDYRAYVHMTNIFRSSEWKGGKSKQDFLRQMVQQMKKNNDFEAMLGDYKTATSKIKVIKGDLALSPAIIVKEGAESYEKEKEIRDQLEKIADSEALLPVYLDHFEDQGNFYYVMQREEGFTLTNLAVSEEIYNQILRLMAKIHVLMPIDLTKYDFDEKTKEKVLKAEFDASIVGNLKPVLEVLVNSEHWGYNKDACTDNWMVLRDGKILICDTEDRGVIPYAVDVAHFLNFVPKGSFEERLNKVYDYMNHVNEVCEEHGLEDKKITNMKKFFLEYCNGVVYRAVSNCGYLFSKERPAHVKQVAKTGIEAIDYMKKMDMIKQEDMDSYTAVREELARRAA